VAQSSFAANNQSVGFENSSHGELIVVKTRSGHVVVLPVGTVNRAKGID